jgi:hypothetical protein
MNIVMKSFLHNLQEADKKQDVPPLLARPEQEDPTKTAHTTTITRRDILRGAGMNQQYLDALAQRRTEHPEIGRTFYLPSITRKDLDRAITVKYGPRGSYSTDNNPNISKTAAGWSESPDAIRVLEPEWNPIRNFLAHETTHSLQDPAVFQTKNPNIRVAGPMPGDAKDDEADKKIKSYLYNKAEPAARASEYKTRYGQDTGTPLSPNATSKDIEKFTDWMWKFSGGKDADTITDIHFYSTPEGAELLRQAKDEKKPENDERLAESVLINTVMKSFLQYITEAGIRRKVRVADSKKLSPRKRVGARADVKREEQKRAGRVERRAEAEAALDVPMSSSTAQGRLSTKAARAALASEYGESVKQGGNPAWLRPMKSTLIKGVWGPEYKTTMNPRFQSDISEGQVVPSPNTHAVPADKRDPEPYIQTPEEVAERKKYIKNNVNYVRLNRMKNFIEDPLGIKSGIQSAVDSANANMDHLEFENMKDKNYRDEWSEQLPRDRDGNPLG